MQLAIAPGSLAEMEEGDEPGIVHVHSTSSGSKSGGDKMFSLKKWNAVAMWSWDVECDTCAICRVQVMGKLVTWLASSASHLRG